MNGTKRNLTMDFPCSSTFGGNRINTGLGAGVNRQWLEERVERLEAGAPSDSRN